MDNTFCSPVPSCKSKADEPCAPTDSHMLETGSRQTVTLKPCWSRQTQSVSHLKTQASTPELKMLHVHFELQNASFCLNIEHPVCQRIFLCMDPSYLPLHYIYLTLRHFFLLHTHIESNVGLSVLLKNTSTSRQDLHSIKSTIVKSLQ